MYSFLSNIYHLSVGFYTLFLKYQNYIKIPKFGKLDDLVSYWDETK